MNYSIQFSLIKHLFQRISQIFKIPLSLASLMSISTQYSIHKMYTHKTSSPAIHNTYIQQHYSIIISLKIDNNFLKIHWLFKSRAGDCKIPVEKKNSQIYWKNVGEYYNIELIKPLQIYTFLRITLQANMHIHDG